MGGESIERRRVKGREGGRHSKAALSGTDDDDGMADETALSLDACKMGWGDMQSLPSARRIKPMRKSNGLKIPRHCFHVSQSELLLNFEGVISPEKASSSIRVKIRPNWMDPSPSLSLLLSSAVTPTRDVSEIRLRCFFFGPFCIPSAITSSPFLKRFLAFQESCFGFFGVVHLVSHLCIFFCLVQNIEMRLLERRWLPAGGQEFTFFSCGSDPLQRLRKKRRSTALLRREGGGGGDDEAGGRVD